MILTSILMIAFEYNRELSIEKIEEEARGYGMHYEQECKVFFKGDIKND